MRRCTADSRLRSILWRPMAGRTGVTPHEVDISTRDYTCLADSVSSPIDISIA
jgi:hypothetical protein